MWSNSRHPDSPSPISDQQQFANDPSDRQDVGGEADHRRDDRPPSSTVRGDDQRAAVVDGNQRIGDRRDRACADFDETLATAATSVAAVAPRGRLGRKSLVHLLERQS